MREYTVEDIRDLNPCYDPVTGRDQYGNTVHPGGIIPKDWTGTLKDILMFNKIPRREIIWLVLHLDIPHNFLHRGHNHFKASQKTGEKVTVICSLYDYVRRGIVI